MKILKLIILAAVVAFTFGSFTNINRGVTANRFNYKKSNKVSGNLPWSEASRITFVDEHHNRIVLTSDQYVTISGTTYVTFHTGEALSFFFPFYNLRSDHNRYNMLKITFHAANGRSTIQLLGVSYRVVENKDNKELTFTGWHSSGTQHISHMDGSIHYVR